MSTIKHYCESLYIFHEIERFLSNNKVSARPNKLQQDTIVLITGGSNGLGLQLVKIFLQKDVTVVILDVVPPALKLDEFTKAFYYKCDISNLLEISSLKTTINKNHGLVSIILNNAGITCVSNLADMSSEQISSVIRINYIGAYSITAVFLPDIIALQRGHVINVASILGIVTPARLTAYGASKGALIAFHKCLLEKFKQYHKEKQIAIKLLLVCPGKIKTEMFSKVETPSKLLAPDIDPSRLAKTIVQFIDSGREGIVFRPYYTELIPLFKSLHWPYMKLLKRASGMNEATKL